MKKILAFSLLLFCLLQITAQEKTHTVKPKETLYGISKQYDVTQDELKAVNPFLNERGLQIGDVLAIPSNGNVVTTTPTTLPDVAQENYEDSSFYYHFIQPKETLYGLSKSYDISQETINNLNTFIAEKGLQIGDLIRIPKKTQTNNNNTSEEVVIPKGFHQVKKGETIYNISKQYNLEMADLYAANKKLQTEGLKAGEYIKIPTKKSVKTEGNYFVYKTQKGDNIFTVMRKYNVTLDELVAVNPELENGLTTGMTLKVPHEKGAVIEDESSYELNVNTAAASSDGEINLLLMMPLFLDTPASHKGERKVAQDFYTGAQIALDQAIQQGKNIKIQVVDTQNDENKLGEFLAQNSVEKVDAVVGPFFQNMVAYVANRFESSNIPVFSPLINSEGLNNYENVYMTTPRDNQAISIIVDEITKNYHGEEIKILTTSNEKEIAQKTQAEIQKKISDASVTITQNPEDLTLNFHTETVESVNEETGETESVAEKIHNPITAVLASENNTLGSQFMKKLREQKTEYIDGYGLFFVPAFDVTDAKNNTNINAMKEMGFVYVASRMVNVYGSDEKKVLAAFKDKFCATPNKYMAIGYDVMYDVIDRMDRNGNLSSSRLKAPETRLSSKIGYQQVDSGKAKVNNEVRIIRLGKQGQ